jgi:magnesium transporter
MTPAPAGHRLGTLLRNTSAATVRHTLLAQPLRDVATTLLQLPVNDQAAALRTLPPRAASAVFELLPTSAQRALLPAIGPDDLAAFLNDQPPDERTLFLSELPSSAHQPLLTFLDAAERARTEALLAFPADSVGRLMTPDYVAIRADWTPPQVLDHVRRHGRDSETIDVLYVIDDRGVLVDDLRLRELLLAPVNARVAALTNGRFAALRARDDQRQAIGVFRSTDRTALPVVDEDGLLIGIVTVDDVLHASQELATRDLQRFGGNEALGDPYMAVSSLRMVRKRAGWLIVLFMGEMLTATAMGVFEDEIARAVVLALFVPLIISSGGNSGSQASTLVIRALALGEIRLHDWAKVARREIVSGLVLGGLLGTIGFCRIAGWSLFTDLYGPHWLLIALTVGLSLVGVVLWGVLVGSMLPLVLRRLGFDPATSSAPFVATLVDVTGLVIYFSVGVLLLRGTVL